MQQVLMASCFGLRWSIQSQALRSMQGSHFPYSIWKLDREELWASCASHLAVLTNDAFRSFHWLLMNRSVFIWLPTNEGNNPARKWRPAGSYSYARVGLKSLNVAVAAEFCFLLRNFEKEVYLTCRRSWWRSCGRAYQLEGGPSHTIIVTKNTHDLCRPSDPAS